MLEPRRPALTALLATLLIFAAGSAAATPPQPLWIAEADGAVAVTAADGTVLFELDELHQVRAATADLERATVWLLAEGKLHAHGFDGTARFTVDVPAPASVHAELAADPRDGTVWLAVDRTLLGHDRHGQLVAEHGLPGVAEAVAVDDVAGRLWVATGGSVTARDAVSGAVVAELALGPGERVRDLDVDRLRGTVWVALRDELRAYAGDGTLLWSTTIRKLETVAADGAGGAWAATRKELLRVDGDGAVVASVEPFGGRDYDRGEGRWIGSENGRVVAVVGVDGAGRAELDLDGSGTVASGEELAAVGIDDGERRRVASLYPVGRSLWRVPIPHFTPWDCNWPYVLPDGAVPPPGDGSVLIADSAGCVRRVNGLGVISTVAGVCRPAGGSGGAAVTDPVKADPGKAGLGDGGYRPDGLLAEVRQGEGDAERVVAFTYDARGRLETVTDPLDRVTAFGYDDADRPVTAIRPDGGWVHYTHDGPLLVETSWSGEVAGTVERGYGSSLRLRERTVNGEHRVERSYDDDGLLMEAGELSIVRDPRNGFVTGTTLGAVTTTDSYDDFGDWEATTAAVAGTDLWSVTVERDKLGRITRKEENLGGTTRVQEYGYDPAGRLIEVHLDGTLVEHYDHDANGNRRTATYPTGPVTATYDDQDRLLTYGAKSYTYTAAGELATVDDAGEVTTLDYDAAGNLLAVELPSGVEIEYLVDGRHRRIGKRVNGTLVQGFLYQDLLNPIAELDGAGNVTARFVYATRGTVPDYVVKGGAVYRILADHLGSPRYVVDVATGAIAQQLDYDAFGQVLLDTNPGFQPFGYAGGLYDPQTGLVRFGARDYDPETGRWTSKDPIGFAGGDANLYSYVLQDPVNLVDPSGLVLDVVADVGFIAYDVYEIIDYFASDCSDGSLGPLLAALGGDLVGAALPFATGLGRGLRVADDVIETGEKVPRAFNPFYGKNPEQIDDMFRAKGFEPRGPDPVRGLGGYVNPRTGRSYHIDPEPQTFRRGVEEPHVDVNRPRSYDGPLPKRKFPLGG